MVTDNTNERAPLLPDRHPEHAVFICDVADAVLKDVMQHMEHPFYALSKRPETSVKRYRNGEHWLEITPSVKGLATIYDKDILIYAISQIMAKLRRGEAVSPRVRINARELLIFANRGTSGREYQTLMDALDRLEGTRIRTNIVTGDEEQIDGFGLIDASSVRRKHGLDGRLMWCELMLSSWVFNAIRNEEVLTLHRDYFRLRKPIERRVYEIARKHCGQQASWRISLDKLLMKTGSQSPTKRFRQMVRALARHDHLPDYHVAFDSDADMVVFTNRQSARPALPCDVPQLDPDVYETARALAPGWDVHHIEREWRAWLPEPPRNPEAAFLGFCRKYGTRGYTG